MEKETTITTPIFPKQPEEKGGERSYGKKLKKKEERSPERAFSLFYSPESPQLGSHCLTVLAIAVLDSPLSPLKTSILEDLAAHPLVYFISLLWTAHDAFYFGGSCYSSFCIVPENKIMQNNIFLMH